MRKWLIRKIAGDMPVILNVTIITDGPLSIKGAEPEGLFDKWLVEQNVGGDNID